jgi:transglutaminase-like putative cysteine protease
MSATTGTAPAGDRRTLRIRLAAFAVLSSLAALQWSSLIAEQPTGRLLGVALIAVLVGWTLSSLGHWSASRARPALRRVAAIAVVVGGTIAALAALGFPARDLSPLGWDRLGAGIDLGLDGLGGSFEYPLTGAGEWARLLLVVPIVPLLIAAAVFAFRPGRDPNRPPIAGLVLMIGAFAIPATARPTAAPLLWGAVLLLLVAAWLWGERIGRPVALATIAAAAVVAIPVTTSLAGDEPPIDYREWSVPGGSSAVTFDWSQTYGPIDWPRTGEALFRVHTDRANFWRAEVLDEFYGDRWRRSGGGGGPVPATPSDADAFTHPNRDWTQEARFEILSLESPDVISPGQAERVEGLDETEAAPDGTTHADEPLAPGTRYSVVAYAPDPRPPLLRSRSRRNRPPLAPYTSLALPDDAGLEAIVAPTHLSVPLWGREGGRLQARRMLAGSAYGQVAQLAERLTAGEHNAYDAAVAIENHLRSTYEYDERPPRHRLPLRAFLFQDGIGYCQQFSGAMALMLRMVGIPARVAAGFAPGTPLTNGHGFVVTDLDAHAWVEVYFNGIGWVPFDPTPPAAPAQSPELRGAAAFALGAGALGELPFGDKSGHDRTSGTSAAPAPAGERGGGGRVPPVSPFAALATLAALALIAPVRSIRHRRLPPACAEERELEELRAVLRKTGWSRRRSTTLLAAESRLREARLNAAATYVRRFRRRRYSAGDTAAPTLAERRSARRELAASGGFTRRVRMLLLMPPGGPLRVKSRRRPPGQLDWAR